MENLMKTLKTLWKNPKTKYILGAVVLVLVIVGVILLGKLGSKPEDEPNEGLQVEESGDGDFFEIEEEPEDEAKDDKEDKKTVIDKKTKGSMTVVDEQKEEYIIRTGAEEFLKDDKNYISVKDAIVSYNEEKTTLEQLLEKDKAIADVLAGQVALTKIFDLCPTDKAKKDADGFYRITINVPALSEECESVTVLHYSVKDEKWEILDKSTADIANKKVTIVSDDLSPIGIFATMKKSTDENKPIEGDGGFGRFF